MKYNVFDRKTGEITYYNTDSTHDKYSEYSDRDKLDSIDIKVIESYIREKKLEKIKNIKK